MEINRLSVISVGIFFQAGFYVKRVTKTVGPVLLKPDQADSPEV